MKCILVLMSLFILVSAVRAGQLGRSDTKKNRKAIIIFYSKTNNTRLMAEFIQRQSGFDMEEISLVTPYTAGFHETVEQTRGEYQRGYLPPIHPLRADLDSYDMILIGSPLWWYTLSLPVMSFLNQYDLSGKIVVPFCTHGTSPAGPLFDKIVELCPNSQVLKGFDIGNGQLDESGPALQDWISNVVNELNK